MSFGKEDPGPGDRIPDFDLPALDGGRFRSTDLTETGPALLVFGSYTCPVTESAAPGLNQLHARFGGQVRFVMVNAREAHPGENIPQPQSTDQKTANAEQLRDVHGFDFEVAVDDIDGTLHRALSPKPNSAYIVDRDGTILFRAQWANDTSALLEALEAITQGKALHRLQSKELIRPMLSMLRYGAPVFDRAGKGSWRDMWRSMPPLAFIGIVLKMLRVGPKS
jgi:thiol-disulfide isomerase/thioredoxin